MRTLWFIPALIACGSVTARPDAGTGTDDANDMHTVDGGLPRFTRVFHTVPQGQLANLYATDIIDGAIAQAKLLSGTPTNATANPHVTGISTDANTVIYTSDAQTEGVDELYVVRFGASGPSQPIKINGSHGGTGNMVAYSALAPDGSHAIYGWGAYNGYVTYYANYYFVDLSGATPGTPTPVAEGSKHTYGVMSRDGSKLAYVDNTTTACGIYVVELASTAPGTPTKINGATTANTACYEPVFSPDGNRVAFVSDSATDDVYELWISNTSTTPPTAADKINGALVSGGDVVAGYLGDSLQLFSPDSNKLAYLADATTDGVNELWIADVSGATPMTARKVNDTLVSGGNVSDGTIGVIFAPPFSFSANGALLVYLADQRTDEAFEGFLVDVSGSAPDVPQRITGTLVAGGDARLPIIARDGSGLAYAADQRTDGVMELFYVDLRGTSPGAPQVVNGDLGANGDIKSSGLTSAVAFSPDGKMLGFVADQISDTYNDFFVADVSTGTPATELVQHSTTANGFAKLNFSADGQTFLYASNPTGTYEIWAAEVGDATPGMPAKVNSAPGPVSGSLPQFWLAPL
jgi:Tol biopolymer transport system component